MSAWHTLSPEAVLAEVRSTAAAGLSDADAAARLTTHGPNALPEPGQRGPWRLLWAQLTATLVLILMAAAVVSGLLGKWLEAGSILAIVVLFVLLGFLQEYRAERAIAALRQLAVPTARVRRGGSLRSVSARELVPGDIVLLEAGNMVPADLRVLEAAALRVQEAALTGEAEPVEKESAALAAADLPLGDRRNLAYLGTVVTYGRGVGVVVATGAQTELGRVAALMHSVEAEQTPLQRRLDRVGKQLAVAGLIVAALVLVIGVLRGEPAADMFLTAISVAVAVVPEGLPAVVTFTLALGAQRMLKRQALIRRLPAVETLGSITTICSDKTGTLTENRMTVTVMDVAGQRVDLTEALAHGHPTLPASTPSLSASPPLRLLLTAGALCNDAELQRGADGRLETLGDPTEAALLVAAARLGVAVETLPAALPRRAEQPFDSLRKRMTTIHQLGEAAGLPGELTDQPYLAVTKGSFDGLLALTTRVWVDDHAEALTPSWRARAQAAHDDLAQRGMRVLAVACRPLAVACRPLAVLPAPSSAVEADLILVGLVGLLDPPREEVPAAVRRAQAAGIRPVMITGDHPPNAAIEPISGWILR